MGIVELDSWTGRCQALRAAVTTSLPASGVKSGVKSGAKSGVNIRAKNCAGRTKGRA